MLLPGLESHNRAVSTATTPQKAIDISIDTTASHQRGRGARCRGSTSTFTCPRLSRRYGLPMNVAATRLQVVKSVCQMVVWLRTYLTNTISQTTTTASAISVAATMPQSCDKRLTART